MSVDLPEPDGPITAVSPPRGDVERDAAERLDHRVALAVAADEAARGDDGRRFVDVEDALVGERRVDGCVHVDSFRIVECSHRRRAAAAIASAASAIRLVLEDDSPLVRAADAPGRSAGVPCAREALHRLGPAQLSQTLLIAGADARDDHRARGHAGRVQQGRHPVCARQRRRCCSCATVFRSARRRRRSRPSPGSQALEPGRQRPVVSLLLRDRSDGDLRRVEGAPDRVRGHSGQFRNGRVRHAPVPQRARRVPVDRRLLHRAPGSSGSSSARAHGRREELRERAERLEHEREAKARPPSPRSARASRASCTTSSATR